MPRMKRPEREIREEKKQRELRALIEGKKIILGLSDEDIALPIGMVPDTFRKKRCHPERFTYPELSRLLDRIKASDEERLRIL